MSSPFQQSSSKRSSWPDEMVRFMEDIYDEELFHPIELKEVTYFYCCIANEPSEGILDLVVGGEEQTPICKLFGKQHTWSTSIQDAMAYLHSTRSSDLQIIKSACPDDFTRRQHVRFSGRLSRLFRPTDRICCNIHKWILVILLRKAWGLTIPDCNILWSELWNNPPVPPGWRYLRPPELVGTAYLRRCLRLVSVKWVLPTTQQDGQQSNGQGLFGKRNIFRIFYIDDFNATKPEMAALDLIFFPEAEYTGAKKVLLLSPGSLCALYKAPLDFSQYHMSENSDYGDSDAPWSSQLLRQLIIIVSNMRRHRKLLLEHLENQFQSFSNFEYSRTPMRCQLARLSDVKTRLHTGNICSAVNDQAISHLIDKVDNTPGLTVSEIDQKAASDLHSMLLDMRHLRMSLEQMEVEFQELRERVRDQLSVEQGRMIIFLYMVMGVSLSLSLLSTPIRASVARWGGAKDIPAASAEELPTISTLLSGVFNHLSRMSYPSVHGVLDILKLCLPGVVFASLLMGTLEGRPLQLLHWFKTPDYGLPIYAL